MLFKSLITNVLFFRYPVLLLLFIFAFPSSIPAGRFSDEKNWVNFPVTFDYGPRLSTAAKPVIQIDADFIYLSEYGYGLISDQNTDYAKSEEKINHDPLIFDGIRSDKKITFRIDLEPGEYWIEGYMGGGDFNIWRGEIRINDNLVLDSLYAYSASFEGEDPPLYWTFLKKINVEQNHLIFSVEAENQPTTLAGLRIFKYADQELKLSGAAVEKTKTFKAPNAGLALRLINAGQVSEAQRIIDPIPEDLFPMEKAGLLLALAGRLETENPRPFLVWASTLLRQVKNPEERPLADFNSRLIELYLDADQWYKMGGWDWASKLTGSGIFTRLDLSGFAYQKIAGIKDHPLSNQALFQLAKLCFWDWVEQHDKRMHNLAKIYFSELLTHYPRHRLLRLYSGENNPLPEISETDFGGSPPWAYYASQALKNTLSAIHYWVDNRQAENGEFGGKYDDDVEMLRWWPIARLAVNDRKTLTGLQRLVDGIWNSDWIVNGFSAKVRDVEHAAEPVADTQPMMIGLDYGNPIYVERCMESIKGLKLWTGINARGHRHFKSSWYSSTEIDARPPRDCDLPMNARTVKAARWLAWYNRHPVAMQFLREWADAWLEDCLRTEKGKPYGIVPSAIRYKDDAIGGHADNWYAPGMFWDYFNFNGGTQMLQQFLAIYDLTGEKRYLQPIELALKLVMKYDEKTLDKSEPGSETWVVNMLRRSRGFADTIEKYRYLTGNDTYDSLLFKYGSDYLKYKLMNDLKYIEEGHKQVWEGIINNGELMTSEGYFTDRIEIGDIQRNQIWGASHLESCYTGTSLSEGFYPFYALTWKGLTTNSGVLVTESSEKTLTVRVHNLSRESENVELNFWRLEPGIYTIEQNSAHTQPPQPAEPFAQNEIKIRTKPYSWPAQIPAGKTQIFTIRQKESSNKSKNNLLADLAFTKSDVKFTEQDKNGFNIDISIHNIGIKAAENFDVNLAVTGERGTKIIATRSVDFLEAPLDLNAKIREIRFPVDEIKQLDGDLVISIDPEQAVEEITELNNTVILSLKEIVRLTNRRPAQP